MDGDQKNSRIGKGLLALLILVIVLFWGLAGWSIWHKRDSSSRVYSAACSTTVNIANNNSFQLPDGWHWYELKTIGIKYAYPNNWDNPTTQTNTGSQKYLASFTVSPSGANTSVLLSPNCSDLQSSLSDINSGKFNVLSDPVTTRAIKHNQTSYSSISHWTSDEGNQYKLVAAEAVSVGNISSVTVGYSVTAGSQSCPDDRLAPSGQGKCIDQTISDEIDKVISSLQKI